MTVLSFPSAIQSKATTTHRTRIPFLIFHWSPFVPLTSFWGGSKSGPKKWGDKLETVWASLFPTLPSGAPRVVRVLKINRVLKAVTPLGSLPPWAGGFCPQHPPPGPAPLGFPPGTLLLDSLAHLTLPPHDSHSLVLLHLEQNCRSLASAPQWSDDMVRQNVMTPPI